MKVKQLPFKDTGFFSKTMIDYLEQSPKITPFYNEFPSLQGFENQIKSKENSFNKETREALVKTLEKQYSSIEATELTKENIQLLNASNTFTITTGHQLNLLRSVRFFLS